MEGDEINFEYDDKLRVGWVVKHSVDKRNTMVYEYSSGKPKWFNWAKFSKVNIID